MLRQWLGGFGRSIHPQSCIRGSQRHAASTVRNSRPSANRAGVGQLEQIERRMTHGSPREPPRFARVPLVGDAGASEVS